MNKRCLTKRCASTPVETGGRCGSGERVGRAKAAAGPLGLVAVCLTACLAMLWPAGAGALTPEEALEAAMEQNPSLEAAVLEMERAELAFEGELYRYVPTFTLEGLVRYGQQPNLSRTGIVSIESQTYALRPGIRHTFPAGTQISGELGGERSVQDSVFLGDLGASWGPRAEFQVLQPWLRGFGRDVGLAQRRSARARSKAAVAARDAEASRVAREVLSAYWQLWSVQQQMAIQQKALEVTGQALEDAEVRLEAGAISEAELVPLQTEEARIRETLAATQATLASRRVELARLLGMERPPEELEAGRAPDVGGQAHGEAGGELPGAEEAVEAAREQSYTLRQQALQIEQAEVEATVARDQVQPRLDTTASVSVSGLGRELPPALESLVVADGVVGMLSLTLEVPIVNKARRAEAERAALGVERARAQYESAEDRVTAGVLEQLENLHAARQQLELARRTAQLAEQNVEYQRDRFENGAATALDVAQTLQEQREAELRVANLRVDIAVRRLALEDLTGELLGRLALE